VSFVRVFRAPEQPSSLKEQRDARQLFAGKGIKFVREDLKNFAKSNINTSHGIFKSVVLYNADYLTIDAIRYGGVEIFSTNTRFSLLLKININCLTPTITIL
jgi:DNA polymerase III delta prime subunit